MANVLAAIDPIIWATASCLPTGAPHCTRSLAQFRTISRHRLPAATEDAGRVRRPVLSVMSASLRPLPSFQRMFSRGTRTSWKRITPFSIPFRPMNSHRRTTSTPGQSVSTMNAVICRRSRPLTIFEGVRAITTSSSATVPFVHHSFSPLRMKACPSSVGTALVSIAAGSEPTPASVSAKAEIAPLARRGK